MAEQKKSPSTNGEFKTSPLGFDKAEVSAYIVPVSYTHRAGAGSALAAGAGAGSSASRWLKSSAAGADSALATGAGAGSSARRSVKSSADVYKRQTLSNSENKNNRKNRKIFQKMLDIGFSM